MPYAHSISLNVGVRLLPFWSKLSTMPISWILGWIKPNTVSKIDIVEPEDTWILQDYGDDRITIVTCTDDGERRMVVTGMKAEEWAVFIDTKIKVAKK